MGNLVEMKAAIEARIRAEFPGYPVEIHESPEDPGTWHIPVFDVAPHLVGTVEDFILALQDEIDPKLEKLFLPLVVDHAATEMYYPEHLPLSGELQVGVATKWITRMPTQWQQTNINAVLPVGPLTEWSVDSDFTVGATLTYSGVESLGLAEWIIYGQVAADTCNPGWKSGGQVSSTAGQSGLAIAA